MAPGALYIALNPDGIAHPDRWSYGPWLQVLKYTPLPHLASFVFGVMLANLDELVPRTGALRLGLGLGGFAGIFGLLSLGPVVPYALVHDGMLMPLFGCMILGLAGENVWPACWARVRWCLWARPATACICCTSTCGT
jgi:peptidoglycan/LPS O-acetylase OafA/YrhL